MFHGFFSDDQVCQLILIPRAKKISQLAYAGWLEDWLKENEGLCFCLSLYFIQKASRGEKSDFFNQLKNVANVVLDNKKGSEVNYRAYDSVSPFLTALKSCDFDMDNNRGWLNDRTCLDAFSMASASYKEMENNLDNMLSKLQRCHQDAYIYVTLGNMHAIAIEQRFKKGQFIYSVYDPNHSFIPKKRSTAKELAKDIEFVITMIKKTDLKLAYFFNHDEGMLLTCNVYPKAVGKQEDALCDSLERKITSLLQGDFSPDIKLLLNQSLFEITQYNQFKSARNIMLSNVLLNLEAIHCQADVDCEYEISQIELAMQDHIYSSAFDLQRYRDVEFYAYLSNSRITILHQVARIRDRQTLLALLPYMDPVLEDGGKETALFHFMIRDDVLSTLDILRYLKVKYDATQSSCYRIPDFIAGSQAKRYELRHLFECQEIDFLYDELKQEMSHQADATPAKPNFS
jgi:hypothetical protein